MDDKENLPKIPSVLDAETQTLLSAVENTQVALKEARTQGGPEDPGEEIENTLGTIENQMKAYARRLQRGKIDADLSEEIRLKVMTTKAALTAYLPTEKLVQIFGSDTI